MYIRKFTYEDFNGVKQTEECCFHLNKAEIIKWLTTNGDYTLDKLLIDMLKNAKKKEIMDIFDNLIRMSIGRKSLDGKRFIKSQEITDDFVSSPMYEELFSELVMDGEKAGQFISAIIPNEFSNEIEAIMKDNPDGIPDELRDYLSTESSEVLLNA